MSTSKFASFAALLVFFSTSIANASSPIAKPVLYSAGGKARACLENILKLHTEDPFDSFGEWKGPGVRASSAGQVDPSTALYIFQMLPSDKWYAIAFYSQDDEGWKIFSYNEGDRLRIGYRARNMERIGYLFRVNPRNGAMTTFDDTIPAMEIDLSPCEAQLSP